MKYLVILCCLMTCGCTESGPRKGHAGTQASELPLIYEPAGAENSTTNFKNSIVYGTAYQPPRNFESSVLNEPDERALNDAQGRHYRVNGSGYGFVR